LLLRAAPAAKELRQQDNTDDGDRCDDKSLLIHCRLTVELSGAHADV
jgi:hypothetical protein